MASKSKVAEEVKTSTDRPLRKRGRKPSGEEKDLGDGQQTGRGEEDSGTSSEPPRKILRGDSQPSTSEAVTEPSSSSEGVKEETEQNESSQNPSEDVTPSTSSPDGSIDDEDLKELERIWNEEINAMVQAVDNSTSDINEELLNEKKAFEILEEAVAIVNEAYADFKQANRKVDEEIAKSNKVLQKYDNNFGGSHLEDVQQQESPTSEDVEELSEQVKSSQNSSEDVTRSTSSPDGSSSSSDAPEGVDEQVYRVVKNSMKMIEEHPEAYARAVENCPGFLKTQKEALEKFGIETSSSWDGRRDFEEVLRKLTRRTRALKKAVLNSQSFITDTIENNEKNRRRRGDSNGEEDVKRDGEENEEVN